MKKPWFFPLAALAAAFADAAAPKEERPPAGAAERIAEALPDEAYAAPAEARKLLVFSRTGGFRHASIPTGKLLLEKMGGKNDAGAHMQHVLAETARVPPSPSAMWLYTCCRPVSGLTSVLKTPDALPSRQNLAVGCNAS